MRELFDKVMLQCRSCSLCFALLFSVSTMALEFSTDNNVESMGRQQSLSGTVVDASDGNPMPGVNVIVKGTTIGTQTDFDGNYTIDVPSGSILAFSYIGYLTQEIQIDNGTTLNVSMSEDVAALDEVVIIGYGTMKKKDVTGAVSSVESKDLVATPVPGVADAIKGRVAGVDITSASGSPGTGQQIRIRGNRSITASNRPLVVLDGIPYPGDINDINTNDIESLEVLKDASSTAIYGSRGANGVILITTKRGGEGRTDIALNSYYGPTQTYGGIDARNAAQYVQQRIDVARFYGNYTSDREVFQDWEWEAIQNGVDTDWMDYVFRNGYRQNHQITVSGGNAKTQFLFSGGFYDEKGTVPKSDYRRFNFRLNLDHAINDWFKIGTSTNITFSERNNGIYNPTQSIRISPLAAPFDENGELYIVDSPSRNNTLNPVVRILGKSKNEDQWIQVNPNLYAELNLTKALKYRMNFAASFRYARNGQFESETFNHGNPAVASQGTDNTKDILLENILSFDKEFGKHDLQLTGLFSVQKNYFETLSGGSQGLPYESQEFYNLGSGQTITGLNSNLEEWGLMSVMGRVHYGFDERFLITATLRADGSSRLAEGNRWGFFPSAAVGWRISEEPFMENSKVFDNLKLRASFGRVGNTGISPYQTQGGLARASYSFGNTNAFGFYPEIIANSDLGWEMTNTINLGVDFSMANGRVSGSLEAYKQYTTDLILSRQLPPTSGYDNILENVGKTENTGFEMTLQTTPISSDTGFTWNSDLTGSYNKEEIVELYDGTQDDIGNSWFIGEPVDSWFFYENIGIWQENEAAEAASFNQAPGSVKLKDQNNDGVINGDDRIVLGSPTPNWVLGWNNNFTYKNFDLTVYAVARLGHVIKNGYWEHIANNAFAQDIHNGLNIGYWSPENPINTYPAASVYNLNDFPESLAYVKGDFFKIRDITLGYTLNKNDIPGLPFNRLRLYATANNYIIIDKDIPGVSIDTETSNGDIAKGDLGSNRFNNFAPPPVKTLIFGLNVTF